VPVLSLWKVFNLTMCWWFHSIHFCYPIPSTCVPIACSNPCGGLDSTPAFVLLPLADRIRYMRKDKEVDNSGHKHFNANQIILESLLATSSANHSVMSVAEEEVAELTVMTPLPPPNSLEANRHLLPTRVDIRKSHIIRQTPYRGTTTGSMCCYNLDAWLDV
jgi:hypothetical protein